MMSVPEVCDGQSKFILIAEAEAIAAGTSRLLATRHHLAAMCQLAASLRQALQEREAVIAELLQQQRSPLRNHDSLL